MKLSIITINLNNVEGLRKTIESVVSQTFTDFEYLVIDGGSTDGSVDIIKQYQDKIKYWISEPDKGVYNAMNKGILQAKGEYCLFLNSGDYLYASDVLKKLFSLQPEEDIVFGNVDNIRFTYPEKLKFSFMFGWTIMHPASFIKRDLFNTIGLYNDANKIASDWCFFMLALYKYDCSYKHAPVTISVFDEDGISSQPQSRELMMRERLDFYKKYFPLFYDDYEEFLELKQKYNRSMKDRFLICLFSIKNAIWKKKK